MMRKKEHRIKAVIFDIGGVLLTDPDYEDFWKKGYPDSKKLVGLFGRGKLSTDKLVEQGSKLLGLTKREFLAGYARAFTHVEKNEKVIDIFRRLKTKKYILSDTNPFHLDYLRKKHGDVLRLAKKAYFSPEIGFRKTDKESYELLIKDMGLKPEEIVMVDNREDCLIEARKLGINTLLYTAPAKLKEDLSGLNIKWRK
jgi:HAD superfamily hydrolase (TIGR01509 family)